MDSHHRAVRLRSGQAVRSVLFLCVLVLVACDSPTMPETSQPVTRILLGYFSEGDASQRQVIQSQAEFDAAWRSMFRSSSPVPETPTVDFSQEMVIIARAGYKPSGGYCIAVESAVGNRKKMRVTVRSGGPTPDGGFVAAVTHPFDVVRVPRSDDVAFVETSFIGNCGPLT